LIEHDLRANAFRVCREGKPLHIFPDHALGRLKRELRRRRGALVVKEVERRPLLTGHDRAAGMLTRFRDWVVKAAKPFRDAEGSLLPVMVAQP
jgi:hypothetical protein